jgi:ParB/RepB/Spo0J family partition protein
MSTDNLTCREDVEVVLLPVGELRPNDYNPNRMTPEEFAELLAEVRHLGRLPKPVIVRRQENGYVIVDGEHGWRAAKESGLQEVPCEVIDGDDFEAMRQTYKRNQHGTHNPVLLGRMFRRMMQERELSARALAKEIAVSEGTVRNAVLYAEAHDLRNSYAPKKADLVERLSVRQVRCFVGLPPRVANLWLDSGGDMKALLGAKDEAGVERAESMGGVECTLEDYQGLEKDGLFQFVRGVYSASGFVEAVKKVHGWKDWERTWLRYGIPRETLRGYTRHFFEGNFYVRDKSLMDSAIAEILDRSTKPPTFVLSAEEFATVLANTGVVEPESHGDFMRRLSLAVTAKTGRPRETRGWVKRQLLEEQLKAAPDYIRDSPLDPESKYALWSADGSEEIKRAIAQWRRLPLERGEDDGTGRGLRDCVTRVIRELKGRQERERAARAKWEGQSEQELAQEMARRFVMYDQEKDAGALAVLASKLAGLTKQELVFLVQYAEYMEYQKALAGAIRALASVDAALK